MNDSIIYENLEQAKAAVREYTEALTLLQARLGVWEENEDSCSQTWAYVRYRNENGEVMKYCYW
jgi:hypothetical protein